MSYTPTQWQAGDTITAEKLNNMESGIEGNSVFLITVTLNQSYINVADKTYSEIQDAYQSGKTLVCAKDNKLYELAEVYNSYFVFACCGEFSTIYKIQIKSNNKVSSSYVLYYSKPQTGIPQSDLAQAVQNKLDSFVVTLTPTAQDLSGTMDKTPQEITAAYEAGQDIEFDVPSLSVKCKAMEFAVENGTIHAGAIVTYRTGGSHLLVEMLTSASGSTYQTTLYALTPVS